VEGDGHECYWCVTSADSDSIRDQLHYLPYAGIGEERNRICNGIINYEDEVNMECIKAFSRYTTANFGHRNFVM
jgi:hypothetical protein